MIANLHTWKYRIQHFRSLTLVIKSKAICLASLDLTIIIFLSLSGF